MAKTKMTNMSCSRNRSSTRSGKRKKQDVDQDHSSCPKKKRRQRENDNPTQNEQNEQNEQQQQQQQQQKQKTQTKIEWTTAPICVDSIEDQILQRNLSKRAAAALRKNRILVKILPNDPDVVSRNDRLGSFHYRDRFVRITNLTEFLFSCPKEFMQKKPQDLENTPSLKLAHFIHQTQSWATESNQTSDCLPDLFKLDPAKRNTKTLEEDTDFPQLNQDVRGVVIGTTEGIQKHLNPLKSYPEACDALIKKIFAVNKKTSEQEEMTMSKEEFFSAYRKGMDFPVIAAMDHQKIVRDNKGKFHFVDFFEETKKTGQPLLPFFLTTCTEIMLRLQLQYIQILYEFGSIQLDPTPLDNSNILFQIDDTDAVTVQMGLLRSNSIMFSVMVHCSVCLAQKDNLWSPGIEAEDPGWLEGKTCDNCGGQVVNNSCFFTKDSCSRATLDPVSMRELNYEIAGSKKKGFKLPTGITSKDELPKYEHACHLSNAKNTRLYIREDYGRKNQRTKSLCTTLYLPVAFSAKKTAEELGLECAEIYPDETIKMHVFHKNKEHIVPMVATRIKLSLSCNKVMTTRIKENHIENLRLSTAHLSQAFVFSPEVGEDGKREVTIHFPSHQATRRIGVQTKDSDGFIEKQTSTMLVQDSTRNNSVRPMPKRIEVESGMYSCRNFVMKPDPEKRENNFLCFGASMVSGVIYNMVTLGEAVLMDPATDQPEKLIRLLPLGKYVWCDLDTVIPSIGMEEAHLLYNKSHHKLKDIHKLLKEKETEVESLQQRGKELEGQLHAVTEVKELLTEREREIEELQHKGEKLEENLRSVIQERDQLRREREDLLTQIEDLKSIVQTLEKKNNLVQDKLKHMEENFSSKLDELEKSFDSRLNAMVKIG